jgi:hypothetical protein
VGEVAVDQRDDLLGVRPTVHEVADLDDVQVRRQASARGVGPQSHELVEERRGVTADVADDDVPSPFLVGHGVGSDHWSAGR